MLTVPNPRCPQNSCVETKCMCTTTEQCGIQYHELELGQNDASHAADHRDAFGVDAIADNVERTVPKASTFHVMFVTNKQLELIELWVGSVSCAML